MFENHRLTPNTKNRSSGRNMVKILLSMIVRNESKIIGRCLESCRDVIDGYVIVDTGSTDDTRAMIVDKLRALVPGQVLQHPWVNFGESRTRAADAARVWASEQGWDLSETYLLLLDADHILYKDAAFNKQSLTAVSYHVLQVAGQLEYLNLRLIRLSHPWVCVYPTHEVWQADGAPPAERLLDLEILDANDGGSKAEKFTRDVVLIQTFLDKHPGDMRMWFYLGRTLFDLGRYLEAFEAYKIRITLGGFEEERWYALYQAGLCGLKVGDFAAGTELLLRAWNQRPTRAEPLTALANAHRDQRYFSSCALFAWEALSLPIPSDLLFVDHAAYGRGPVSELATVASYLGQKDVGMQACESLTELWDAPHQPAWFSAWVARTRAKFYTKTLSQLLGKPLEHDEVPVSADMLHPAGSVPYSSSTPCFVSSNFQALACVRLVNYDHERGRWFVARDKDGVIRTRIAAYVVAVDEKTPRFLGEREVIAKLPESFEHNTRIRGLEDQRWFMFRDHLWSIAMSCQTPGAPDVCRQVLLELNVDVNGYTRYVPLKYAKARSAEKNWLPFVYNGELHVIYDYSPFLILKVDTATGECVELPWTEPPWSTNGWKGSTPPILYLLDDRSRSWIFLVHETAYFEAEPHNGQQDYSLYSHRLVEMRAEGDGSFVLVRRSLPFYFLHQGVEYSCGMSWAGGDLLIGFSCEERESHWMKLTLDDVEALLSSQVPLLPAMARSSAEKQ